jgi:hypothetical protein
MSSNYLPGMHQAPLTSAYTVPPGAVFTPAATSFTPQISRGAAAASTLITYALSHPPAGLDAGTWESMLAETYRGWLWNELQQPRPSLLGAAPAYPATGGHTMPTTTSSSCSSPAPAQHSSPVRRRPHRSHSNHPGTDPLQPAEPLDNPAEQLTPSDEDTILRSSIGQPEVLDITDKATDADVAEVMRRRKLRAASPDRQQPPPDYTLEGTIASGRILSHRLMRLGYSYAADGFLHRARICFQAALESGHPDAQEALDQFAAGNVPELPETIGATSQQLNREPVDPTQLIEQGVILCNSGDEDGAREAFAQAVVMSSAYLSEGV